MERGLGAIRCKVHGQRWRTADAIVADGRAAGPEQSRDFGHGLFKACVKRTEDGAGEQPGEVREALRGKDVDVDCPRGAIPFQMVEHMPHEAGLSEASRRDEREIPAVFNGVKECPSLRFAVAERLGTGISGGEKGIGCFHAVHCISYFAFRKVRNLGTLCFPIGGRKGGQTPRTSRPPRENRCRFSHSLLRERIAGGEGDRRGDDAHEAGGWSSPGDAEMSESAAKNACHFSCFLLRVGVAAATKAAVCYQTPDFRVAFDEISLESIFLLRCRHDPYKL